MRETEARPSPPVQHHRPGCPEWPRGDPLQLAWLSDHMVGVSLLAPDDGVSSLDREEATT